MAHFKNRPTLSEEVSRQLAAHRDPRELQAIPEKRKTSLVKARAASQARTHEEKSKAARKAIAHRDPNELRHSLEKARKASQARTPEEKSEASRKAAARRDPVELRASLQKAREVSRRGSAQRHPKDEF